VTESPERSATRTEDAVCRILRVGVSVSLVLVLTGSILSFMQGGYAPLPGKVGRLTGAAGAFPRTAAWLLGGLRNGSGQAIIVAGLLVLISTPILRVAVSIYTFARERDRAYVLITALVLSLLLLSFFLGKAG
jgi:uncharacterized membrane protein